MKIKANWNRLKDGSFWKLVDEEHNRLIAEQLTGCKTILDIDCGYGSLTNYLVTNHFNAIGIDVDQETIDKARILFPLLEIERFKTMNADFLDFPDKHFDAIVMRDSLHHLLEGGNINKIFSEIERVIRKGGVLIIFEPNPNFIVSICRRIIHHKDPVCHLETAVNLLKKQGWKLKKIFFTELFSLPLSGGYVGLNLVPNITLLQKNLIKINSLMSRVIFRMNLGSAMLWRYCVKAEFYPKND